MGKGSVNKVFLLGNLTKDPVGRNTQNGNRIVNFDLATNDGYGDNEKTNYHKITILSPKLAEVAEKYLTKGSKVHLEGSISNGSYVDKQGVTKYTTEILCWEITMIGSKKDSGKTSASRQQEVEEEDVDFS